MFRDTLTEEAYAMASQLVDELHKIYAGNEALELDLAAAGERIHSLTETLKSETKQVNQLLAENEELLKSTSWRMMTRRCVGYHIGYRIENAGDATNPDAWKMQIIQFLH